MNLQRRANFRKLSSRIDSRLFLICCSGGEILQEPNSTLGTVLAVLAAAGPHARATAADGLTLSVYANTAGAAPAAETSVVTLGPVTVTPPSAAAAPFSAELTGTLYLAPAVQPHSGANLTFVCDFGGAVVGYLHIDDHLVCSTGVNSEPPSVLVLDQPLTVLTRTMLPVRMFVSYNGSSLVAKLAFNVTPGCTQPPTATKAAASNNNINININNSQHTPAPRAGSRFPRHCPPTRCSAAQCRLSWHRVGGRGIRWTF